MEIKKEVVAIVGAGNGGMAFAGYLGLQGYRVILSEFEEFASGLEAIREKGSIEVSGEIQGSAPVEVAGSIDQAVADADLVMAPIPAHVHGRLAREVAGSLPEKALLVLNPGRTGGALEVYQHLRSLGSPRPVVEAQTLLFACRKKGPTQVHISGTKKEVAVGVIPADQTAEVNRRLTRMIPSFFAVDDIRITSIHNIGALFHPTLALVNASRIEAQQPYGFYTDAATPRVAELLEALDRERVSIGEKAGVNVPSIRQWLHASYGLEMAPLHRMLCSNPAYQGIMSPSSLDVRYFHEDVPTGLVPLEVLGRLYGVDTPLISSLIHLSNALMGRDYREIGRTEEVMGIAGMNAEEFLRYIQRGLE